MSHSYYGLILKARSTDEAEEKAQEPLKLLCGDDGYFSGLADNYFDDYGTGIILSPNEKFPYFLTSKVTSDSAKQLMNWLLEDCHRVVDGRGKIVTISPNGDKIFLDEKGEHIGLGYNRLFDNDYFIVPY